MGFVLFVAATTAPATQLLSNLGNIYPQGIGDIHGLVSGGDTFIAHFSTGAGTYQLNSVTIEFLTLTSAPATIESWNSSLDIRLFQADGGTTNWLGSFENPQINSAPTQWPQSSHPTAYTTYVDYDPNEPMVLQPFTEYSLLAHKPDGSSQVADLLFSKSADYVTPADWQMDPTSASNTFANGEFLKLAVGATLVPQPGPLGFVFLGCALPAAIMCRRSVSVSEAALR